MELVGLTRREGDLPTAIVGKGEFVLLVMYWEEGRYQFFTMFIIKLCIFLSHSGGSLHLVGRAVKLECVFVHQCHEAPLILARGQQVKNLKPHSALQDNLMRNSYKIKLLSPR